VVRAKGAEGLEMALAVEKTVAEYRESWGVMPHDRAAAGLLHAASMRGDWVSGVQIMDGAIAIGFTPELASDLQGRAVLLLRPAIDPARPAGAVVWVCQDGAAPRGLTLRARPESVVLLPSKYLPGPCKSHL
jgi:type IV pilus assembly protein PilA